VDYPTVGATFSIFQPSTKNSLTPTKGPIYVVSISQPADQRHQALFFQSAAGNMELQGEKQLFKKIIDTVRILK